ncbi:MAG TPA: glycine cleavage T C-terminal barrel domain-containing protein [Methylomirabilota bacterium]|nr:glycine cleavage T C-terminal barrel domain-containing protein [Methylomirabilota bacterium]
MTVENPLLDLHRAAGATLGTYFGCELPARFTNSGAEYRAARDSVVLADTNFHAMFRFTGPDRARYLNAILTSNVRDLAPDQGTIGLLLNPQGHILAEIETLALGDLIVGVSHASVRESTAATIEKFIIMDDVVFADESTSVGSLALAGPRAAEVLQHLSKVDIASLAERTHQEISIGGITARLVRRNFGRHAGAELLVPREHLPTLWNALAAGVAHAGGGPIGFDAINSLRLEAGVAWFGYDFGESVIPHEAGLENSHISYTKGCYTGQEIVERVRSRGQVNRRRVSLRFDGADLPANGSRLLSGAAEAGHVTSAAYSFALDRNIGMGYVRREHSAAGSRLQSEAGDAEVIELPLPAS